MIEFKAVSPKTRPPIKMGRSQLLDYAKAVASLRAGNDLLITVPKGRDWIPLSCVLRNGFFRNGQRVRVVHEGQQLRIFMASPLNGDHK